MKIRMKKTVIPDWPLNYLMPPGTVLLDGQIYSATQNRCGAVSGICENGELLGVKPEEFEIVETEDAAQ